MVMFVFRRVFFMIFLLAGVNFFAFAYAHYGRFEQRSANPIFAQTGEAEPVLPLYKEYVEGFLNDAPAQMPAMLGVDILKAVGTAAHASLGLLGIAFLLSLVLGFVMGVNSARTNPPRVSGWLIPITAVSLAMPGFYVGAMLITASVFYLLNSPSVSSNLPFPLNGFGWDEHLVFPVIALSFRPAVQIAQTTAILLSEEFKKNYVSAALSLGHSWRLIQRKTALQNIFAPLAQVASSSLRLMVGELILVEWLFGWPGLGRLLASSLQLPEVATVFSSALPSTYLHAPTVATVVTALGAILIAADLVFSAFAHSADPRLRVQSEGADNG
ncbi:MAG: ABC transporter permease subunit [Anaerolineales bacterium]|nr:ABC transporter permease subunit [Anaerolineales bacterium]